jgi:hypothetical protein
MKLIDKHITEVVSGYDDILQAEIDLRSRWRPQLLAAYTKRQQRFFYSSGWAQLVQNLPLIGLLVSIFLILVGVGITCRGLIRDDVGFLLGFCGGPLLVVLGLLILAALAFSKFGGGSATSKRVPLHPLRGGPQKSGIYPNLRFGWCQGLSGGLKEEIPDYPGHYAEGEKDHGAEGERLFVRRLLEIFDDRYFVLARSVQRRNEDVDVILIGPKGIWVFEVKHWSGEIYWDDQGWRRSQTFYESGGSQVTQSPPVGEPPDHQWIRAAAEVTRTLQYRATEVLQKYPALGKVRGGIVFTKPEASLRVQPGRPVFWGHLNFWLKALHDVEPKANLNHRETLQIVEALLERHHTLSPVERTRSMRVYAQGVVQEAEERLTEWVKG